MTDRELMQQALDAMLNNPDDISDEMFESIKALKERLAQSEKRWVKSYAGGKPNYTTPEEQTRQWQGLTDDEVAQAMYRADAIITGPMQFKFAKEIEAKLKEKNT